MNILSLYQELVTMDSENRLGTPPTYHYSSPYQKSRNSHGSKSPHIRIYLQKGNIWTLNWAKSQVPRCICWILTSATSRSPGIQLHSFRGAGIFIGRELCGQPHSLAPESLRLACHLPLSTRLVDARIWQEISAGPTGGFWLVFKAEVSSILAELWSWCTQLSCVKWVRASEPGQGRPIAR